MLTSSQAERKFKPVGLDQASIAENGAAGTVGDDLPTVEEDRRGAGFQDHLQVVGGDQLGGLQALDQADEPAPAAGIEVGCRLVEDEDRGPARQNSRQAHPLSLAEAEMMGRTIGRVLEIDAGQAFQGQLAGLGFAESQVERPKGHVFDHGGAEELIVGILEQQADLAADLRRSAGADLDSIDPDAGGALPFRRARSSPW